TLFGMVLVVVIVVDDAIVVLENIDRWLDKGLPVRDATIKAMNEITGPILAITLVLSSVLLPSAFLGGITGQFFRQFALTISVSMLISAVNAMTMTPARAAWIFASRKPGEHGDQGKEALPWWSFALFGGLATVWLLAPTLGARLGLPAGAEGGEAAPGGLKDTLLARGVCLVLFVPPQDKGYLLANIQLPEAASLERTAEVTGAAEKIALETPGVAHTVAIPGQSFVLNAFSSNYSSMFIILKPFHERRGAGLDSEAILSRLRARLQQEILDARVIVFGAPAVRGLGNAGGFKLMVEAAGDVNFD